MVAERSFKRHAETHLEAHPAKEATPAAGKPPKLELRCFYCGKVFARFNQWKKHEDGCVAAAHIDVEFPKATPACFED